MARRVGLLHDHDRHRPGPVAEPRARRPRAVPGAARGGLRPGGEAGWLERAADHLPPHAPVVRLAHHRHDHAPATADDPERDCAELPRARTAGAGDLLGGAAPGRAELADGRAVALAALPSGPDRP